MDPQLGSDKQQCITIRLEIAPENEQDADPPMVIEVARNTVDALREAGYTVNPVPTGQRGGIQFLFDVITFLENIPGDIWSHRDILDTLSALCTIFSVASPIVMHLLKSQGKHTTKQATKVNSQDHSIKVTMKIDGAEILIESSDLETEERIVMLGKRFLENYPALAPKITPQSKVQIKRTVPKRQPRRR